MKVLIVAGTAIIWGITTLLVYRLARFRNDHRGKTFFGTPPSGVFELLSAETYTAEGHRLLPYLWVALAMLVLAVGAVVFVVL